jgi:hypothetical protein
VNEIVLFEIDDGRSAQRLCARLGETRLSWVEPGDDSFLVGVLLGSSSDDLAHLLRAVEAWLADEGLILVPFQLDSRTYVLQGRGTRSRAVRDLHDQAG